MVDKRNQCDTLQHMEIGLPEHPTAATTITIRLPIGFKDAIQRIADKEHRTLSGMIRLILWRAIEQEAK